MKPGFVELDWAAPIDVDAYVEHCPADAKVKGIIMTSVLKQVERRGAKVPPGIGPFHTFKDYSLRDHMRLVVDVAKIVFPHKSLRESLRQLGRQSFPALRETLIGKVVFGSVEEPVVIYRRVNKAYEITGSRSRAVIVEHGPRFAHMHISTAYGFLDTFHVGTSEGVCIALGRTPHLTIKRHSLSEAEFFVQW